MSLFPFKILDPSPERKESNHISSLKGHGSGSLQGPLFPYPKRLVYSKVTFSSESDWGARRGTYLSTYFNIWQLSFLPVLHSFNNIPTYFLTLTIPTFLVTSFQLQSLHFKQIFHLLSPTSFSINTSRKRDRSIESYSARIWLWRFRRLLVAFVQPPFTALCDLPTPLSLTRAI